MFIYHIVEIDGMPGQTKHMHSWTLSNASLECGAGWDEGSGPTQFITLSFIFTSRSPANFIGLWTSWKSVFCYFGADILTQLSRRNIFYKNGFSWYVSKMDKLNTTHCCSYRQGPIEPEQLVVWALTALPWLSSSSTFVLPEDGCLIPSNGFTELRMPERAWKGL